MAREAVRVAFDVLERDDVGLPHARYRLTRGR
jgi:hypothetical protein